MAVDLYRREYKDEQKGVIGVTLVCIIRSGHRQSTADSRAVFRISEQRLV